MFMIELQLLSSGVGASKDRNVGGLVHPFVGWLVCTWNKLKFMINQNFVLESYQYELDMSLNMFLLTQKFSKAQ